MRALDSGGTARRVLPNTSADGAEARLCDPPSPRTSPEVNSGSAPTPSSAVLALLFVAACSGGNEIVFVDSNVTANFGCTPMGFPCIDDDDCETNLCFGNVCSLACTPTAGC